MRASQCRDAKQSHSVLPHKRMKNCVIAIGEDIPPLLVNEGRIPQWLFVSAPNAAKIAERRLLLRPDHTDVAGNIPHTIKTHAP